MKRIAAGRLWPTLWVIPSVILSMSSGASSTSTRLNRNPRTSRSSWSSPPTECPCSRLQLLSLGGLGLRTRLRSKGRIRVPPWEIRMAMFVGMPVRFHYRKPRWCGRTPWSTTVTSVTAEAGPHTSGRATTSTTLWESCPCKTLVRWRLFRDIRCATTTRASLKVLLI